MKSFFVLILVGGLPGFGESPICPETIVLWLTDPQ